MISLAAFVDELEKIAVELSAKEKRRQALQFGVLGAAAAPAISAIKNKVETGTMFAPGTNKKRWLAANLVGGALATGALPIFRHHIEQKNLAEAKARVRAGRS